MAIYSDLDSKLNIRSDGNLSVVTDEDCIVQSINNILSTVSGERVRNPIGSSVVQYLFQPINITTARQIRRTITESISKYESRATLDRVVVNARLDENRYDVVIDLRIAGLDNRSMTIQRKLRAFG